MVSTSVPEETVGGCERPQRGCRRSTGPDRDPSTLWSGTLPGRPGWTVGRSVAFRSRVGHVCPSRHPFSLRWCERREVLRTGASDPRGGVKCLLL